MLAFGTWWRTPANAEWTTGPRWLISLSGESELALLSWGSEDGSQSTIAFSPGGSAWYGHRHTADGDVLEVRGQFSGAQVIPSATWYEFDTEAETDEGRHPAGRLRVLVDDGGQAALRWVNWQDRSGTTWSIMLRSASPSGNADVTDLVSSVWASAEYRDADEVALNLVDDSPSKWLAFDDRASVEFELSQPVPVTSYALVSANDFSERDPAEWTLRGSPDGYLWHTLDTRADQSFDHRHQAKQYPIAEPGPYDRYRLDIAGTSGSEGEVQLQSLRLRSVGSGGFVGYRQRAGEPPTAYRGTRVAPAPAGTPGTPLPDGLPVRPALPAGTPYLPGGSVPLVRTDFSDDGAWAATCQRATAVRHSNGLTVHSGVEPVDDIRFEGLTAAQLVQRIPAGAKWSLLLAADRLTMTSPERAVLVIGLDDDTHGETFRATPMAAREAEVNVSLLANMDWESSADNADDDGIVRAISVYDPVPFDDE
ncbi:hypothetical protein GCM10009754_35040 [Amycolatopsis minnesotensis]|uniref:F5/8 type C domain-containing protein n=1 Tax=Amycolatopsis minnesotensis TaxID=337894 RepID=A0ABP5CEP0_9PSEU